jgi:hypothetical protein
MVDFPIENRKMKIMEEQEAANVVKNAVNSGRINMTSLISYAKRRKLKQLGEINQLPIYYKSGGGRLMHGVKACCFDKT